MVIKSVATLIYEAKTHNATTGSPSTIYQSKQVKVDVAKTFHNSYYFERGREMREACNLIVNEYHTRDYDDDGNHYELAYVMFKNVRYKVMTILNNFVINQEDPFHKVLDCKKVTNA